MPTGLDRLQQKAGRRYLASCQAELDALNRARPPDGPALVYLRVVRHECAARGGESRGIELIEHYEHSPAYWACYCSAVGELTQDFPHNDCDGGTVIAAAGLFGFIWKQGRCPSCRCVLRSTQGRFVVAASRPPAGRRHGGGQARAHPGDPRFSRA